MNQLLILAVAGFVAQLIDGALGMGYGVTSTSMLLALGLAPAVVSASVHAGEVVTTLVSGIAHWRFGNVDPGIIWRLAIPGALGAFVGAFFLAALPIEWARPGVSAFLLVLGVVVLVRFLRPERARTGRVGVPTRRILAPLGLVAGFLDAAGGGGWGPVATSTLIARRGSDARKVVGSVDASEFLVALSATVGFVLALGWQAINLMWVAAICLGGIFAAPLAAWAVRILPTQTLGLAVGAMILVSNSRTILSAAGIHVPVTLFLVIAAVALLLTFMSARIKKEPETDSAIR